MIKVTMYDIASVLLDMVGSFIKKPNCNDNHRKRLFFFFFLSNKVRENLK